MIKKYIKKYFKKYERVNDRCVNRFLRNNPKIDKVLARILEKQPLWERKFNIVKAILIGQKKEKKNRKIISYSRVSTLSQKAQLKEQTKRIYDSCISRGLTLDEQFEDIKSGMSSDRPNFQKILQMVIQNEVELLVIENKDRLTRFGYDLLEQLFKYFGTKILVLNNVIENKTYEQELTEDLISIIHYFTMKNYSHRRKLNKLRKEIEENNK